MGNLRIGDKFPTTLYVHEPLTSDSNFDGYTDYQDAEGDDIVAVYTLSRICKVKAITTKELENL